MPNVHFCTVFLPQISLFWQNTHVGEDLKFPVCVPNNSLFSSSQPECSISLKFEMLLAKIRSHFLPVVVSYTALFDFWGVRLWSMNILSAASPTIRKMSVECHV
jgi:hypothetical protein